MVSPSVVVVVGSARCCGSAARDCVYAERAFVGEQHVLRPGRGIGDAYRGADARLVQA